MPGTNVLMASEQTKYVEDWSGDGKFIIFVVPTAGLDLWILPTFGARQPRPFLESPFLKDEPQFSPDGRWVAYNSNETGRWEAYVTSFPDAQQKFPVSTLGGIQPQWRADGRELFYLGLDGTMMSATVDTGRGFVAGVPTALFPTRLQRNPGHGPVRGDPGWPELPAQDRRSQTSRRASRSSSTGSAWRTTEARTPERRSPSGISSRPPPGSEFLF